MFPDDRVPLPLLHDLFDADGDVAMDDCESERVGAKVLIRLSGDDGPLGTVQVASFADDLEVAGDRAEDVVDVLKSLVDVAKQRLVVAYPRFPLRLGFAPPNAS